MSGTITPTVRVRSVRSEDAATFGRYPSRSLALRILLAQRRATPDARESGLSARDTVDTLTPDLARDVLQASAARLLVASCAVALPPSYFAAFSNGCTSSPVFSSVGQTTTCLRHVLELADVAAADVLELGVDDARLRPLAVRTERDRADDRVEGVGAE